MKCRERNHGARGSRPSSSANRIKYSSKVRECLGEEKESVSALPDLPAVTTMNLINNFALEVDCDAMSEDDLNEEVVSRQSLKLFAQSAPSGPVSASRTRQSLIRRRRLLYEERTTSPHCPADGCSSKSQQGFVWDLSKLMTRTIGENRDGLLRKQQQEDAEFSQLFRGFTILDTDRDGFITVRDLVHFFHANSAVVPERKIKSILWCVDEKRRDCLTYEDVMLYYMRVTTGKIGWIDPPDTLEGGNVKTRKETADPIRKWLWVEAEEKINASFPPVSVKIITPKKTANLSASHSVPNSPHETLFLFRLLFFVTFYDDSTMDVHLLSALQELVRLYGRSVGEKRFEIIFSKNVDDIRDSDRCTIRSHIGRISNEPGTFARVK